MNRLLPNLTAALRILPMLVLLAVLLLPLPAAVAAPVDWHEVAASAAGRQWWDQGSLRIGRSGHLSVLSRFQPAQGGQGQLFVMEVDCGQRLYRDTAVNGIPRWRAPWLPASDDGLIAAVIQASCQAAGREATA